MKEIEQNDKYKKIENKSSEEEKSIEEEEKKSISQKLWYKLQVAIIIVLFGGFYYINLFFLSHETWSHPIVMAFNGFLIVYFFSKFIDYKELEVFLTEIISSYKKR